MTDQIAELQTLLTEAEDLFKRLQDRIKIIDALNLAPLALFRQIIDMGDAVRLLAEANEGHGSIQMVPLLRSMLENFFSLEYILARDSKNSQDQSTRSLAWFWFCIHQEIKFRERLNPSTARGKDFRQQLKSAGSLGEALLDHVRGRSKKAYDTKDLYERLEESDLVDLERTYQQKKKQKKKEGKNWEPRYFFELVDSIRGIEGLARKIGRWPVYEIYYRWFSAGVHGTDPVSLLRQEPAGTVRFRPLTANDEPGRCVEWASYLLYFSAFAVLGHYRPILEEDAMDPQT
ncbi:MAG: hypothetical protein HY914_18610 [Desulfomonile tiedjei]|nr:hypothetical protein [Desulfomonile tiedjei]